MFAFLGFRDAPSGVSHHLGLSIGVPSGVQERNVLRTWRYPAGMVDLPTVVKVGLEAAIEQARKSEREGGIPIGSCLLNADGVVVAVGHNLRVQAGDPTAHAETVCIRNAGRRRDWHTLTLVSTLSPCAMCTGTSILHRIPRVVIGERQNFQGREDWFAAEKVGVEIVNDARCVEMMKRFIAARPDLWWEDIGVPPGKA